MTEKKTAEEFEAEQRAIPDDRLAEMAQNALSRLCETGGRSITMTVPPRVDDTDMIISELIRRFKDKHPLPPAEGAEEILASLVESLGEPDNSVTDHSYQIRPLTVEGKREWWMFHNGVGSGEPLAEWLSKFAALHAQKIADKIVEERLREELIAYDKWYIFSPDPYTDNPDEHAEYFVTEYLKSRDNHE